MRCPLLPPPRTSLSLRSMRAVKAPPPIGTGTAKEGVGVTRCWSIGAGHQAVPAQLLPTNTPKVGEACRHAGWP